MILESSGTSVTTVGSKKKPWLPERLPPVDHLAAAALRVRDERVHRIEPARIGERAHRGVLLQPVAELDRLGVVGEALEEAVVDRSPARRSASARCRPGRRCGT
jgi:hypothetical protein